MNTNPANLKDVLSSVATKVNARKLEQLEQKLEAALRSPLEHVLMNDTITIRRRLVEHLRDARVSPGVIHHWEQFFMGVVRRAAVMGILPPPPEGPWTRPWQTVIDATAKFPGTRAALRSLAAWATTEGLKPVETRQHHLKIWARDFALQSDDLNQVMAVLNDWRQSPSLSGLASDKLIVERLRRKAIVGSVRVDRPEVQKGSFNSKKS